ncbi:MAG: ImmA/IrrE family metallo-endopeptidase [Solirubrobacteraceae bacterium]
MEEIEQAAERVLARVPGWIWDGETLPVPVEAIVDDVFGLLVREVDDLAGAPGAPPLGQGQTFSGLLLPDLGEIWVNRNEARQWPPRRRFTIGHELGHWCVHREGPSDGAVYCRAASVDEAPSAPEPRPARAPEEEEANVFAAALLMPARLIRREYQRDREFGRLCETFGVSGAAMGRRLRTVI